MKTSPLPRVGEITRLGFGGAQLGNLFRTTTDEEAAGAVETAWNGGIRYFDTAPHYGLGLSEQRLGHALAAYPRDEYLLSTKVGRLLEPTPERAHLKDDDGFDVPAKTRRVWDFSRDGVRRSIEESLARLGVDRLDIAYLHDPDEHWESASTSGIDALIELRDEGVVGAIGAGMNQAPMLARFIRECDVDVVMMAGRYTLIERVAEEELLAAAEERGVAIIAAGVYNSGLLGSATIPDDAHFEYGAASPRVLELARRMADACNRYGIELPAAAVQFALRTPAVRSVVLGVRNPAQVSDGLARVDADIPDALWQELDAIRAEYPEASFR